MGLNAAGVPKAANVLVNTKETLIKTSYRELREEIVFSPNYYIVSAAQCRKRQAEKLKVIERGCCSVLRENQSRLLGVAVVGNFHKNSSLTDSAERVSFELGCRDELAMLLNLLRILREILPGAYNLNKAVCSLSFP